jgi:rubredoxin
MILKQEIDATPFTLYTEKIMAKMKCPCKYVYDPEVGDPKQGIPPGTKFEDLPDTWRCPRCKRKKERFVPIEE